MARTYKRRSPVQNHKDAQKAKPEAAPYQRKVPEAPGLVLRVETNGTKTWKLVPRKDQRQVLQDRINSKRLTMGTMPVMTYAMAVDKALAVLRGEDPDDLPDSPEGIEPVLTFGRYLEKHYQPYLEQNHSRPNETAAYLKAFGLADTALEEIRLADVETWRLTRQRQNRAASTLNRQCSAFKAALQRAVEWDLLDANPLAKLKLLKVDRRPKVRYLTDQEEDRLVAALKARDADMRAARLRGNDHRRQRGYELMPELGEYADHLTPMVMLALNCGLRRGELWNLNWGDVDFRRKMLTVHGEGAKSKQTRHVPLNATAVQVLKTWRGGVHPLPRRPIFGRIEIKKPWAVVLKAARVEDFRFHDTRHTFASRLVMAGIPLNTVRELLGHASIDTTLIYAHLAPDNLREAVKVLEGGGSAKADS